MNVVSESNEVFNASVSVQTVEGYFSQEETSLRDTEYEQYHEA